MSGEYLTLKDMIEGSGCTPRTVRYYERQGLLTAERSAGGHRLFDPGQLDRLEFIISLREAGWSLEEITTFLSVRENGTASRESATRLTSLISDQIKRLERKLEVLARLREDLVATRDLLPTCVACTEIEGPVSCGDCSRLPASGELPRAFRLTWRGGEPAFDERLAGEGPDDA